MGSPAAEPGHQPDEAAHRVRLTKPFYLSAHEISRRQWDLVMSGTPPSPSHDEVDVPVVNVSWFDVADFVARLNGLGHGSFRVPTEAEWEYACRAGTTGSFSTGATLSTDQANYDGRFPLAGQPAGENRGHLTRVGSFPPNPWGVHDMHGNAWEWIADPYCPYGAESSNPVGACESPLKVIRGGSWRFNADSARCALRYTHRPQDRGDSLGFRLVRAAG